MMEKNKELAINTIIIFIGKFCTQFVSFLLIPIYTHYLLTADYGYIDLVQTYITLLAPIIILRFDSAIFRFLIDCRKNDDKKSEVISSSFYLILLQIIILILIFIPLSFFIKFDYSIAILLNIIFVSISSFLLQLTRGIGKNIDYSIGSIISAIITIGLNILLIVKFRYNAASILYASAVANIACSLFLIFKNKIYKYLSLKKFSSKKLKEMLKYSLPMIPDGLSWWIVNVSDRTIITIFINSAANGIYAVSSKFSNILSSIFQIFNMSWQESASIHIKDDDRDLFFTDILNKTYVIFYSCCILILVSMPFVFQFFIGKEYLEAYKYVPILLFGNLFSAIANVIGGVYIAKKETNKVARTTVMAAIINILINVSLIKIYGLYAAAFSTLISYIVVALYRYIDVNKTINMKFNYNMLIITMMIFTFSTIIYYINNVILNLLNLLIIIIILIIFNRNIILIVLKKIRRLKK